MLVMGTVCCDPKQLPSAYSNHKNELIRPNRITLSPRLAAWQKLPDFPRGAIMEPTGVQTGRVWICPFKPGDATSTATLLATAWSIPYGAIIPAPGDWFAYYDSATAGEFSIKETGCTVPLDGYSVATHTAPAVGAGPASTVALAANAARRYALFVNDGTNVMYLNLGAAAVANTGIRLNANGGSYELYGKTLYRGAVNFIGTAADVLLVTEGV